MRGVSVGGSQMSYQTIYTGQQSRIDAVVLLSRISKHKQKRTEQQATIAYSQVKAPKNTMVSSLALSSHHSQTIHVNKTQSQRGRAGERGWHNRAQVENAQVVEYIVQA